MDRATHCLRADDCSFAAQATGGGRLFRVLRHLYCDLDGSRCARMRMAARDEDVPPDLMPNGYSTSEVSEVVELGL
jgi:hypothetical protein